MSTAPSVPARRRPSTWIAIGLLVLSLAMVGFMLVATVAPGSEQLANQPSGIVEILLMLASVAAWLAVVIAGVLVALKRPRNPIGWMLVIAGFSAIYANFASEYVLRAVELDWPLAGYRLVDWVLPAVEMLGGLVLVVWIPLLFPDGRLPGHRWRPIAWLMALVMAIGVGSGFLTDNDDEFGRQLPNPTALGGAAEELVEVMASVLTVALVGFIVLAFISVVVRFRRSLGVERQQIKWFLAAVSVVFVAQIGMTVGWILGLQFLANAAWYANQILPALFPIAIGIAVLRYRLYEIDRIISRTIGWALVTGLLVGAFALLVLGSSAVLEPLTGGNTLAVAGSTLVVALLFAPLRGRVQRQVDRRFDRSRYDGERTLAAFGERLRDEVDLTTIRADVLATVDHSVRPTSVGLWLRGPEERV